MPQTEGTPILSEEVNCKLQSVRRENRKLRWLSVANLGFTLLCLTSAVRLPTVHAAPSDDGILHVRGLVVEDSHGVERLRLGAPLPDPMVADGVRHKRQGPVSGLIISDAKGTERGGYVTDDQYDEAFFTLDSRKGQEVLFLANPGGGTNLDLFDKSGNEAQITVFPDGPKFVLKRAKKIIAQLPANDAK
ncbi:MAG TPA: hypothetical protein VGB69_02575 [Edaphobacter sp.]